MNIPPLIVVLALSAMLGIALMVSVVLDRRRGEVRTRIDQVLRPFGDGMATGTTVEAPLRLERATRKRSSPAMALVPDWFLDTLKEASAKAAGRVKPLQIVLISLVAAVLAAFVLGDMLGLGPVPVLIAVLGAGIGVPLFYINFVKAKFDRQFLAIFPDALDLIVRAIRSGLPVSESIANVGFEVPDPVGAEFRRVTDEMAIAVDPQESLKNAADRVRITDFQFFVASLTLQRQTGGNLADTLSNLSGTIRRRNEARLKVRALSSEGRISALILSGLPIFLGIAMDAINPTYMHPLFNDPRGKGIMIAAGVLLFLGIMVMRTLIKRVMR